MQNSTKRPPAQQLTNFGATIRKKLHTRKVIFARLLKKKLTANSKHSKPAHLPYHWLFTQHPSYQNFIQQQQNLSRSIYLYTRLSLSQLSTRERQQFEQEVAALQTQFVHSSFELGLKQLLKAVRGIYLTISGVTVHLTADAADKPLQPKTKSLEFKAATQWGWSRVWLKKLGELGASIAHLGTTSKRAIRKSYLRTKRNLLASQLSLGRTLKQTRTQLRSFLRRKKSATKRKQRTEVVVYATGPSFKQATVLQKIFYPFYVTCSYYPKASIVSVLFSFLLLGGTYVVYDEIFRDLPAPIELSESDQIVSTKILDRNGNVLYRIYQDENRTLVNLSQISPYAIQATIAIEDKDFYSHHGFSLRGIFRAAVSNFQGNDVQGGSTLTQQLVKNKLLTTERTYTRKIKEVLLSVLAEGIYTKEQILEMYFNQIAYGGATYGIEEAAQRYFGKHAKNLSLAESALLAGLPAAPSVYSPFGTYPELAKSRQVEVLRRMVEDGYITQEEAEAAAQQQLAFVEDTIEIEAPHFVMYVRDLLVERYGQEVLTHGGLIVRTTLDLELHKKLQTTITDEVTSLERLRISNGAGLITNPKTGEVLSMVGSKNYFDFEHDGQVNVTLSERQPGSSIKPLTYALAFELGKSPSSIIDDSPITYSIAGSRPYSPENYDGSFHGKVSLRQALASSYNIPAVKLLNDIGVSTFIDFAEDMGITTWTDRKRFGLSLTLGGGEVKMVDMAKAYSAFANQGKVTDINPILEIENYKGEQLYVNTCALAGRNCRSKQVLSPLTAYMISDVLSDNRARTPAFGPLSSLYIPEHQVAVKTGTTNNLRDNWTIGYTQDKLVSIWVGNNDNTPMSYVASGVTGASPIWSTVMNDIVAASDTQLTFDIPSGMEKVAICVQTGTLACQGCPTVREEYFPTGAAPTIRCSPEQFSPKPPIANQSEPTPAP